MEHLPPRIDTAIPANALKTGKLQRWVRAAILGTLPFLCGGDAAPHADRPEAPATRNCCADNAPPPKADGLPGTLSDEKMKNPACTEEQYFDLLARTLTTPEKLDRFLRTRMRYAWDSPNPDDPLQEGTQQNHGSYGQTPQETIRRTDKGKMLGDCEDYAILAQEILRRQGKNAHVVFLPEEKHAMCVWVEKDEEGRYRGQGADENGVICPTGKATLAEAICGATRHYPFHPYCIPVCRRVGSFWYVDVVSIHAFDPDLPGIARIGAIELMALGALLGGTYGTYRHLRRREEKETWKGYFTTFRLH